MSAFQTDHDEDKLMMLRARTAFIGLAGMALLVVRAGAPPPGPDHDRPCERSHGHLKKKSSVPMPTVPAQMPQLVAVVPVVDSTWTQTFAQARFGITAPVSDRSSLFVVQRPEAMFRVDTETGAFRYRNDTIKPTIAPGTPPPDPEQAEAAARGFLTARDLFPSDAVFAGTQAYDSTLAVRYRREVSGRRLFGPGSQLTVTMSPALEVMSVYMAWPALTTDGNFALRTADDALAALIAGDGFLVGEGVEDLVAPEVVYYVPPLSRGPFEPHLFFRVEGKPNEYAAVSLVQPAP